MNQVFLDPPADIEPKFLRWALRGRDVRPFRCCPRLRLLWTHDAGGLPLSRLPPRAQPICISMLMHFGPAEIFNGSRIGQCFGRCPP